MTAQQGRKQVIRNFMRTNYTDERLAMLLAHAKDGKLGFFSCCCFVGVSSATHALRSDINRDLGTHGPLFVSIDGGIEASNAYGCLWKHANRRDDYAKDAERRRILIPMIRAEMKRRDSLATSTQIEGRNPVCSHQHKVWVMGE